MLQQLSNLAQIVPMSLVQSTTHVEFVCVGGGGLDLILIEYKGPKKKKYSQKRKRSPSKTHQKSPPPSTPAS